MNNTMDVANGFHCISKSSYFESKHKTRPSNFKSIAEARIMRTARKSLHRKSARKTTFDNCRNISPVANAAPSVPTVEAQSNRRWLLLQQWKEEKEKKKRETKGIKKKPFVVGAPRDAPPLSCLPAVPKPPISRRVTRSQAAKKQNVPAASSRSECSTSAGRILVSEADFLGQIKKHSTQINESFAPANAVFHPPQNLAGSSILNALGKGYKVQKNAIKQMVTFEPVVLNKQKFINSEPTQSVENPKAVESTLSRKRNHGNQSKLTNQSTQLKTKGLTKTINTITHTKNVVQTARLQDFGAVTLKDNDKTIRMTRQNIRLIDKDKQSELKTVQCYDTKAKKLYNLKSDESKPLHTRTNATKVTKVKETDVKKPNEVKLTAPKTMEPKSKAKESDTKSKVTVKKIDTNYATEVNSAQARSVTKTQPCKGSQSNTLTVHPQNTPIKVIPKSESSSEEKLRSPPQSNQLTPEQIRIEVAAMSPCVTVSRGKSNARKETIGKLKDGLLGDDFGDTNTVDHFRSQLNSEIKRLTAVSDHWHKYAADNILPENIEEMVLAAVGQTRLLMSKKLQQFSQLVEQCASGEARPEGAVTTSDLQGFWDMVFMQVDNVDMRFKKLSELRDRQWVTEETTQPTQKPLVRKKAKGLAPGAPSKIRAMIEAARKAKLMESPRNVLLTEERTSRKDFDAGFFSVTSPVRDATRPRCAAAARLLTPISNKSPSLLKDVLSSEARKTSAVKMDNASRAMMRASVMAKNMDQEPLLDMRSPPLQSPPHIYTEATPARSILKTPNVVAKSGTRRKSAKTVLFCDADEPQKVEPTNPSAGLVKIIVTPNESSPDALFANRGSVTKRNPKPASSPGFDQENVAPEESPMRRMTRGMRRSLAEPSPLVSTALTPTSVKRATRTSARLTEVH